MASAKVLILLLVVMATAMTIEAGCYDDWSRCSRWSYWGTGRIWPDCKTRCKNLGRRGGVCRKVDADGSCWINRGKKIWQCQCY